MEKYVVTGGAVLKGEVTISGAKNAVVAIIPATVLARDVCVIENIPNISDVTALLNILRDLGAKVRLLDKTTVEIDTTHIGEPVVSHELAKPLRASYYFLGSLLGRCGRADVSLPGGCNFGGVRPIDQHIKGFKALGADVSVNYGMVTMDSKELRGEHIYFDVVSVGATINVMLAAVKAKGVTIMENVAKEPHIVDLANFLNSMGADIRGAGTDVIKIHGVDVMHGTNYSIIPDQIEAGTYMVAAAATGGDVLIQNVIPKHLESITDKLRKAGAEVEEFDDSIRVSRTGPIHRVNLKTLPHPGFPTDMQPMVMSLLTLAKGTCMMSETVFEARFRHVAELCRMGANIQVHGRNAAVFGVEKLHGAKVRATDLRSGAALLLAALAAEGETIVEGSAFVERGYEKLEDALTFLGGRVQLVS